MLELSGSQRALRKGAAECGPKSLIRVIFGLGSGKTLLRCG